MKRRDFVSLVAGAAVASPLSAQGEERKPMPLIGWLSNSSSAASLGQQGIAAFRQGLSDAGFVEGRNVAFEYRWADGHYDRLPQLAADLIGRKVDVIAASGGGDVAPHAAKIATSKIPIVFIGGGDPVEAGLVAGLAHPGGNITGISFNTVELTPKRLELLSELVPQTSVIGLLVNPNSPTAERTIRDVEEAARVKGVQVPVLKASSTAEFTTVFASLAQLHGGGLVVAGDPAFGGGREQLVDLAARQKVPAIYAFREYVDSGGLISYGPSLSGTYRQGGTYVGRILAGAKPADLPMQQPTVFELVVNLKTANALGLTIPQSVLQRADEVLE